MWEIAETHKGGVKLVSLLSHFRHCSGVEAKEKKKKEKQYIHPVGTHVVFTKFMEIN